MVQASCCFRTLIFRAYASHILIFQLTSLGPLTSCGSLVHCALSHFRMRQYPLKHLEIMLRYLDHWTHKTILLVRALNTRNLSNVQNFLDKILDQIIDQKYWIYSPLTFIIFIEARENVSFKNSDLPLSESIVTKPPSEKVNFIKTATKTFYLSLEGKFSFDMM